MGLLGMRKEKFVNKREERKRIEEVLRESASVQTWQDKPYTAVKVIVRQEGERLWAYGFAKVQYPDEWDGKYGIELALSKAIAKLSKAIINEV